MPSYEDTPEGQIPPAFAQPTAATPQPEPQPQLPPQGGPGYTDPRFAPTTWGSTVGSVEDLQTPSGQWCQVRRPGAEGLIAAGVIHSMDALSGIVQTELIPAAEGKPKVDMKKIMADPQAMTSMIHTMDRIVCHVVLQPKIEMTPNDATRRQPGVVYADMVDLEDKTFIMSFAMGGTKDIATFRAESTALVGSVGNEPPAASTAQPVVQPE